MGITSNNETYKPTAQDFLALMKALSRPGTTATTATTATATWQQRPHCRRRRRVRFTTTDAAAAVAATTTTTSTTKSSDYHILLQNVQEGIVEKVEEEREEEEGVIIVRKEDLWYGSNDIANFKTQKVKMLLEKCPIQKRYAIERKRYMLLSIRCTLSAQKQGFNSEDIALVSQKCSEWCTQLAKIQGCHDYFDVYFPKLTSTLPDIATIRPMKFPFPIIQTNNNTSSNNHTNNNTNGNNNGNKKRRRVPQGCCWRTVHTHTTNNGCDEVATNELLSSSSFMMDDDTDTMQYHSCVRQRQRRRTSLTAQNEWKLKICPD